MRTCSEAETTPVIAEVGHRTDTLASAFVVDVEGKGSAPIASRKGSTLVLRDGDDDKIIARVGAQMAMGDLDQDGAPEIVSTVDTLAAKYDAVEVRTVHPRGTVMRRMKLPAPRGVRAVAVCPPDGPDRSPLVVATGTELWVVR
jgi:hypothetical protein